MYTIIYNKRTTERILKKLFRIFRQETRQNRIASNCAGKGDY